MLQRLIKWSIGDIKHINIFKQNLWKFTFTAILNDKNISSTYSPSFGHFPKQKVPSFRWKSSGLVFTHFCNSWTNFWKLETLYNNLKNLIYCKKYISLFHIRVPYTCYQQVLSEEANQLWNESDHSPPPSSQIKNTSTTPKTVMAQCSIKYSTTLTYFAFLYWSPVTVNKPKSKCTRCIKIQYRNHMW